MPFLFSSRRFRTAAAADVVEYSTADSVARAPEPLEVLVRKGEAGDANALLRSGLRLIQGLRGAPKDAARGWDLLERAAATGHLDSRAVLGRLLAGGCRDARTGRRAGLNMLWDAACEGHQEALVWLAEDLDPHDHLVPTRDDKWLLDKMESLLPRLRAGEEETRRMLGLRWVRKSWLSKDVAEELEEEEADEESFLLWTAAVGVAHPSDRGIPILLGMHAWYLCAVRGSEDSEYRGWVQMARSAATTAGGCALAAWAFAFGLRMGVIRDPAAVDELRYLAEEAAELGAAEGLLALVYGTEADVEAAVQQVGGQGTLLTRLYHQQGALMLLHRFGMEAMPAATKLSLLPKVICVQRLHEVPAYVDSVGESGAAEDILNKLAECGHVRSMRDLLHRYRRTVERRELPMEERLHAKARASFWLHQAIQGGSLHTARAATSGLFGLTGWSEEKSDRLYDMIQSGNRDLDLREFEWILPQAAGAREGECLFLGGPGEDGWADATKGSDGRGETGGGSGGCGV